MSTLEATGNLPDFFAAIHVCLFPFVVGKFDPILFAWICFKMNRRIFFAIQSVTSSHSIGGEPVSLPEIHMILALSFE